MYLGYLIRLGGSNTFEISPDFIKLDSYNVTWNSQEYIAWRNAKGLLNRESLASRPPKVEFYTRNMMTNTELSVLMNGIRAVYDDPKQKKVTASIYIPEIDGYITDDVYMADCTPSIYRVDGNTIYYNSFRMAFVGYGKESSYK